MLSVAALLNPAPSESSLHNFSPSPAFSASPSTSLADTASFFDRPMMPRNKIAKDAAIFTKGNVKGAVNFPPFERLDEASLLKTCKYNVFPLGKIQDYCRHIPYNSGKKDFFDKTGRESFEVFQYVFKAPGDDTEYAVMWDYNVGLVRMTPFFKCCKYSKTTPAKMLNLNPGLKEITHSITGGSIVAQGYWMPYECAKAVCATFCHHIAGALIPIFGPDFPAYCIPPEAPEHGRMIIASAIIAQSTKDAEHFRRVYSSLINTTGGAILSKDRKTLEIVQSDDQENFRHYLRGVFSNNRSFDTEIEVEVPPGPDRSHYATVSPDMLRRNHSGWTPANMPSRIYETPVPSPWLSAIPRLSDNYPHRNDLNICSQLQTKSQYPTEPRRLHAYYRLRDHLSHHSHLSHAQTYVLPTNQHARRQLKRSAEKVGVDYACDSGESRTATGPSTATTSPMDEKLHESSLRRDKNAALLLMHLSVRDTKPIRGYREEAGVASETASPIDGSFPRVKRFRANSM